MERLWALTEEDMTGGASSPDHVSVTKIVTQFRFIFDISDKLRGGAQEETLTVKVRDPTDTKVTPDNF